MYMSWDKKLTGVRSQFQSLYRDNLQDPRISGVFTPICYVIRKVSSIGYYLVQALSLFVLLVDGQPELGRE